MNKSSRLGPRRSVTKKMNSFSTEMPYLSRVGNPVLSSALKFWISLSSCENCWLSGSALMATYLLFACWSWAR